MAPEEKRGRCHAAMVQTLGWAARSLRRKVSCGDPVPHPPSDPHSLSSTITCQLPPETGMSKLYQGVLAVTPERSSPLELK